MTTCEAIWIANGRQFVIEAEASARSFLKYHPSIPMRLITPHDLRPFSVFASTTKFDYEESEPWYKNLTRVYRTLPDYADRILLFDTDTYINAPLDGPRRLLNRFDFLGCHAAGRRTTGSVHDDIGLEFPEINIGFLAFNSNASVRALFDLMFTLYTDNPVTYNNNDQGPLRDALYEWDGSFYVLPPEFNFRFECGGQVRGRVSVLHGRSKDVATLLSKVKSSMKIRSYRRGDLE